MTVRLPIRLLALIPVLGLGGCYGLYGHDEMDRYFQRSDTLTMSAGDAKQVNAVTHTIHPWPRNVNDRRLAYDGRRMGAAVDRYGRQIQPRDALPDIGDSGKVIGPRGQNVNINQTVDSSVTTNAGAKK